MFYLFSCILISSAILVFFKLGGKYRMNIPNVIMINYLVAGLYGFFTAPEAPAPSALAGKSWILWAVLCGALLIAGFHLFARSARQAGITVTAIASRMSVIIPVTAGLLFFSETLSLLKVAGICLGLASFVLILKKDDDAKAPAGPTLLLPLILFMVAGLNDTTLKLVQFRFPESDFILFLATAFSCSLVFSVMFNLISGNTWRFDFRTSAGGIVLGLLNWWSTLFFLKGLDAFPAIVFLPSVNAGIVTLSSLTGIVFFREKANRMNIIGISLAVAAIIILGISSN